MKCFFCNADITEELVYEKCETHIEFVDEGFKEKVYCSRICAIAEDILFNLNIEQIIAEDFQDDYDVDVFEKIYQVVEDVMEVCRCTCEELLDAFTRIEVVVGESPDIVDKELLKYQ
jgi:hypothetical protein